MLEEFRARVAQSIADSGLSVREIGERVGKAPTWVSTIQNRGTDIGFTALFKLADALRVNPVWLATGLGPKEPPAKPGREISQGEAEIVRRWHTIPDDAKGLMRQLAEWMAEPDRQPLNDLAQRRADHVLLRLVGTVAAREETAAIDFDTRTGDEVEVPAELVEGEADQYAVVTVSGESMSPEIPDGAELLVCRAELGQYQRGDLVVASTAQGEVVKIYAGQRKGVVTLDSLNPDGQTITAPKSEEPGDGGIAVQLVGRALRPRGGEWTRLRRPLSSRWR